MKTFVTFQPEIPSGGLLVHIEHLVGAWHLRSSQYDLSIQRVSYVCDLTVIRNHAVAVNAPMRLRRMTLVACNGKLFFNISRLSAVIMATMITVLAAAYRPLEDH